MKGNMVRFLQIAMTTMVLFMMGLTPGLLISQTLKISPDRVPRWKRL